MDLILLIDSSNTNDQEWQETKHFAAGVVGALMQGQETARVGVIVYARGARNEFYLNKYVNEQNQQAAIQARIMNMMRFYPNDVS